MWRSSVLIAALLVASAATAQTQAQTSLCMLRLPVTTSQSQWNGGGRTRVPTEAYITSNKLGAVGDIFLAVPANGTCPPKLTAANAVSVLERASLMLPIGEKSLGFKPADIKSNITVSPNDTTVPAMAVFDFYNLGFGLTGNEPLGPGAVKLGTGSLAEAKASAQDMCSQVLLLGGVLNLTSILGPRTADVQHVAFNRSIAAGASVQKDGDAVGKMTLYVRNATIYLNVSPETVPGVAMTRAWYMLSGDIVATADLSDKASWEAVPAEDADWTKVSRLDAPVVIATDTPDAPRAKAKVIGVNSTLSQQCTPTRMLDAATGGFAAAAAAPADGTVPGAAGSTAKSAAGSISSSGASSGCLRVLALGAVGAVLAAMAV